MKLYTNTNNTATLKLLLVANLSKKTVELANANYGDPIFSGPKSLPLLVVNEDLSFFSSNAAAQYLFPVSGDLQSECDQLLELEATRIYPLVQTLLSSKNVAADWKQVLAAILKDLDDSLGKKKYLLFEKVSTADIAIWATIYPLYHSKDHKQHLNDYANVLRWFTDIDKLKEAQEAVKQWNGNPEGPLGQCSSLGLPAIPALASPTGSPEQAVETGPNSDEVASAKDLWETGFEALPSLIKQDEVILPVKGRKNVLITSALPYVNNVPHLGNIIGCVLSADIFARYARLCNYNVLFICGTDEYGTATETKALEEGVTPREICDKYNAIHRDVYKWFNISFDYFGRTSTPEQTEITQKMFMKLDENGFISKQSVQQLHCENCNRFLADRFVEGTCHHPGCLYDNARGDQCDKCGKLINAVELSEPRCKVCGNTPVKKASEQFFLELGQLEGSVHTWALSRLAGWSPCARAVCRGWLREGLRARAITRDLHWGVPLPRHIQGNKVFYVWFDAPMGYMSITECATKQYEKWWKPEKEYNVKLYQFMAKDNVPFHAVMFPATLLGVNEGHILVHHLFATEYLNYEEGKFSKSRGVGVFGTDAQDTGIPSDVWRFYLASIRPEGSDSSFSWAELGTRNNSELLNNLGNFCHRSLSFCYTSFKGVVPDVVPTQEDYELMALVNREVKAYVEQMERGRLREALRHVLLVGKLGNGHMQASQPWVLLKGSDEDRIAAASAINICCQIASLLCILLSPYMPDTTRRLSQQLNLKATALRINLETPSLLQYLKKGHKINKPEPLFTKIEPDTLEALRKKYAGTQADRKNAESAQNSVSPAQGIPGLEAAITAQGEKVRQLKSSTKDKAVWQPEVNKLLDLKKQLAILQKNAESAQNSVPGAQGIPELEAAIATQGEKVRQLKSSTKDKAVWQPEVNKLLDLKKQLAILQQNAATKQPSAANNNTNALADLEAAVAKQGEKVRQLKGSTKDKTVWQPEVNILLELKKQLSALQERSKMDSPTNSLSAHEQFICMRWGIMGKSNHQVSCGFFLAGKLQSCESV